MKTSILFIFLFLGATSWSQEEPQTAPVPDIPAERVPAVGDSNYVYRFADVDPEFPGGREGLFNYLASNIQYPQRALKKKLEGKCYLQFVVSNNGWVINPKVMRGVPDCPECDEEALRVVRTMPQWKPGEIDGKPVHSTYNLPISFKLN